MPFRGGESPSSPRCQASEGASCRSCNAALCLPVNFMDQSAPMYEMAEITRHSLKSSLKVHLREHRCSVACPEQSGAWHAGVA